MRKFLFGLVVIILWLLFIIAYRIIGGKIAKAKKAITNEEDMKKYKKKKRRIS